MRSSLNSHIDVILFFCKLIMCAIWSFFIFAAHYCRSDPWCFPSPFSFFILLSLQVPSRRHSLQLLVSLRWEDFRSWDFLECRLLFLRWHHQWWVQLHRWCRWWEWNLLVPISWWVVPALQPVSYSSLSPFYFVTIIHRILGCCCVTKSSLEREIDEFTTKLRREVHTRRNDAVDQLLYSIMIPSPLQVVPHANSLPSTPPWPNGWMDWILLHIRHS